MENILSVENLSKDFGSRPVLENISFTVPKGAVFGLLGNNGEGKSTLIRLLLGLLKPDAGTIHLFDQKVKFNDVLFRKKIGCLIDSPCLYEHLTAAENLKISQEVKDLPRSEVDRVLEITGMKERASLPVKKLSLGMKQRVAIANSLLGSPQLLILDEPTNGLDPKGIVEIRELLKQLPQKSDTTVFLSSHILTEIEKTVSHLAILENGVISQQSSLKELQAAQKTQLIIETPDQTQLTRLLKNKGFNVSNLQNNQVVIENVSSHESAVVNQYAFESGAKIVQSRLESGGLENLFFANTD